ncbi:MAG: ABC transporter transmembrane domain-containing protein [Pseudomonadota bacterium]
MFRQTDVEPPLSGVAANEQTNKKEDLRPLRMLFPYIKPYWRRALGAFVALIISSVTVLGLGQGLRYLVDQGFISGNAELLDRALIVLFAVVIILAVASFARFYLISSLGERVVADLRRDVYSHLVRLHTGFFEVNKTSEIISRLTADTTVLQMVVGSTISVFLRNMLLFLGGTLMLFITSPELTVLVAVVVPVVLIPIILLGRQVRRLSRASQDRIADVGAVIDESLYGIRTVQAFGRERGEVQNFIERVESAYRTSLARISIRGLLTGIVILLVFSAVGIILWLGGHRVVDGRMSGGELSSFVFYAIVVAGGAGAISEVIGDIQRAAGATERLFGLMNVRPEISSPPVPVALGRPSRGAISFVDVNFNYPSRQEVTAISDFSLEIAPGETVALVGPSGAGKTTIFQLLLRFYDPQKGRIFLDGVDISYCDPRELRSRMALVPQDPVIFSTSVLENIRYGRPEAGNAAVRAAAQAANALEFIDRLPSGMDTHVGERGVRLSGGQRQRIAIARAILVDPSILLLDEATSALDSASEKVVQQALSILMRGRTTFVIAHRLATIQNASKVVVMDQGQLIDVGSHSALMSRDGLYARLANLQFDARPAAE